MNVLDIPMDPDRNDANAATVRDYLKELLATLWEEEESFSGKRPFGNSGWQSEVHVALVKAGVLAGSLDSDGYLNECDSDAANALIAGAIKSLK